MNGVSMTPIPSEQILTDRTVTLYMVKNHKSKQVLNGNELKFNHVTVEYEGYFVAYHSYNVPVERYYKYISAYKLRHNLTEKCQLETNNELSISHDSPNTNIRFSSYLGEKQTNSLGFYATGHQFTMPISEVNNFLDFVYVKYGLVLMCGRGVTQHSKEDDTAYNVLTIGRKVL